MVMTEVEDGFSQYGRGEILGRDFRRANTAGNVSNSNSVGSVFDRIGPGLLADKEETNKELGFSFFKRLGPVQVRKV